VIFVGVRVELLALRRKFKVPTFEHPIQRLELEHPPIVSPSSRFCTRTVFRTIREWLAVLRSLLFRAAGTKTKSVFPPVSRKTLSRWT